MHLVWNVEYIWIQKFLIFTSLPLECKPAHHVIVGLIPGLDRKGSESICSRVCLRV